MEIKHQARDVKHSYGLICFCRNKNRQIEVLMVKKPISYGFAAFINGMYRSNNKKSLIRLFSCMTFREKIDILTKSYETLWTYVYPTDVNYNITTNFTKKKACFENEMKRYKNYGRDGKSTIKQFMSHATLEDTHWEFPKGRKNVGETDLQTALREFHEETFDKIKNYKVCDIRCYTESRRDYGVEYINKYFFAMCDEAKKITIDFNHDSMGEIVNVKWFPIHELIGSTLVSPHMSNILRNAKKIIKSYYTKNM